MKFKINQDGFSAIDIILVIVALAAIGATVYFAVFHKTTVTITKTEPVAHTTAQAQTQIDGFYTKYNAASTADANSVAASNGSPNPAQEDAVMSQYMTTTLAASLQASQAKAQFDVVTCQQNIFGSSAATLVSSANGSALFTVSYKNTEGVSEVGPGPQVSIRLSDLKITNISCPSQ
jgi:hypothetical protein